MTASLSQMLFISAYRFDQLVDILISKELQSKIAG